MIFSVFSVSWFILLCSSHFVVSFLIPVLLVMRAYFSVQVETHSSLFIALERQRKINGCGREREYRLREIETVVIKNINVPINCWKLQNNVIIQLQNNIWL